MYTRFFNGRLDDVRVYAAALSAQEIAALAGASPAALLSAPAATLAAPDQTLTVAHIKASMSLHAPEKDRCAVSGSIAGLPAGYSLSGQNVALSVGDSEASFTLDAKGRARSSSGTVVFKLQNGTATFSANLSGGVAAASDLIGTVPGSGTATLPVALQMGGSTYTISATVKIAIMR